MKTPVLNDKLLLTVDLNEIIDRLQPEERAAILKHVGFDLWLMKTIVEMLSTGAMEDGYWFDSASLQELRDGLTAQMQGLQIETIATLRAQRDQAKLEAERHSAWAWAMYHAWGTNPRPEAAKFEVACYTTREEAAQILAGATPKP